MYAFELGFQSDRGDKVGLAIFSGQLEGDALDYAASFETLMSKALRPDFVAFIFPEYLTPSVASFVENEPAFIDNLSRFGARTSVLAYSFNVSGRLIRFRHRKLRPRGLMPDSQALTKCVVERGMQSLAEKHETEIVIQAPPGSRFTKPSGETSDEFIRAAGLANDYVEHQFVAYCLLTRAPARRALRTIYIDTGSIAGIAEAVSYYLFKFSRGVCKPVTYRTFSSYEGLKGEQPDSPESIWVIISASFSNNLGRKICSEWGLASDQVTTVLTYSDVVDDGKGGGAVACIKTLSKIPESRVSGDVRTSVRIIGENFTAEVSAPIPVRLKTAHKPPGMDDFMRVASQRPVISCHRKGGGRVRAIHLDFQATLDAFSQMGDSRLQSWIERAINWYVPRNLGWIIHDSSDEGHGALLECVQRILGAQGYPKNLRLCDVRDGFDKIWGDVGVLVLSPVTATGRLFSRVNRELRLGEHRGNRIFLSPFVMAPSTHAFTSLRNSLCYAPEGFKYQFLNFMSLRVGHSAIDDSWSQEAALIEQFDGRFWRSRRAMLAGQSVGIREGLGASTKSLELAEDFVYWRGYNYKPSNVASGAVYATIAAVLQNQREVDPYSGSDSLRSLVYRHAVLDPVNFEQFNDPLIQICLWRCSESGEMDFRRSDDMSEALLHVIRHSLRDFKDGKQSALLDILIGIAVGRIRVSRECVTAMQGDFTRQPKVAHLARDLLRAIAKLA